MNEETEKPEKKTGTVHSARTIMLDEFTKVMDISVHDDSYEFSLSQNLTGKRSSYNAGMTGKLLKKLYGFNTSYPPFLALKYFWQNSETSDKPLLSFVYAIYHDYLLSESIEVIQETKLGEKAEIERFMYNIERLHPMKYSDKTKRSASRNLISSWKKAGFFEGKVKNIRSQPEISAKVACFAFLLAYLKGDRGDYIWNSAGVRALCLHESKLRELAIECAKRDLMQYQYAGSVTAISFNNLLNKIGINGNKN
jgi:hypothetical protein